MGESGRDLGRHSAGLLGVAVVVLFVLAAVSGPVAAHAGDDGAHHHDGWMGTHDGMGGWTVGGLLWMVLLAVVLIGLPVALVYILLSRRESGGGSPDDALAVLRRRYARGEIDEAEFEARRETLQAERD